MFPAEFEPDNYIEYTDITGNQQKKTLGRLYIDAEDEAIKRYYNRSNFCYTTQNWNFTDADRRINHNCNLLTNRIRYLIEKRKELVKECPDQTIRDLSGVILKNIQN